MIRRIAVIIASLCGAPAAAQLPLTIDAGAARLQQSGIPSSSVSTLGADLRVTGGRSALAITALGAFAPDQRRTGQAVVAGSIFGPGGRAARPELSAVATTFGSTGDYPTSSAQLVARGHFESSNRDIFVGAGGGGITQAGLWRATGFAQAGVWWRARMQDQLIATVSGSRAHLFAHTDVPGVGIVRAVFPTSYGDLAAAWSHDARGWSLNAAGDVRVENGETTTTDGAMTVSLVGWVAPQVGVVLSGGRALRDVVRGVPSARYAALSLRVSALPHPSLVRRPRAESAGPRVVAIRADERTARLELRVAAATTVEIMGDFTQWQPVSLAQRDGVWQLERGITPGPHRIAVRIDGGEWIAPSNLPRLADELGGTVGLITVP